MAESLGFEGHIAWAEAMIEGGDSRNSTILADVPARAATGPFVTRSASSVHTWRPPSVPIALQEQASIGIA